MLSDVASEVPWSPATSSVPLPTVAFPIPEASSLRLPPTNVSLDVTMNGQFVRTCAPSATLRAPTETAFPLKAGDPDVTVMELSERAARSFVVDCPAKTRSSPLRGAVPPAQFAPLLQRRFPPAPVHVLVDPNAANEMRNRPKRSETPRAIFMTVVACQMRASLREVLARLRSPATHQLSNPREAGAR